MRRISVAKYPYPYPFKQGNFYPIIIRIRENCGYPQEYLPADTYPRISDRQTAAAARTATQQPPETLAISTACTAAPAGQQTDRPHVQYVP